MGNNLTHSSPTKAFESISKELPEIIYAEPLGNGWFLKTTKCNHKEGPLVVKVYPKENLSGDTQTSERIISYYQSQLLRIKQRLSPPHLSHNVAPFQKFIETRKNVYLLRQYFYNSLHDRVKTRPYLTQTEKIWLTYLLLKSLDECHSAGICHGDIKLENIMLTSWNWLYLTDFACYKPTHISDSTPVSFSYYFDTSGSRICHLAPERFVSGSAARLWDEQNSPLTPEMDVFALGTVIAELFLDRDSAALFNLGELLSYKDPVARAAGTAYDPNIRLARIPQKSVRKLVLQMIELEPSQRGTPAAYLDRWTTMGFPSYFGEMYTYTRQLMRKDADSKVLAIATDFDRLHASIQSHTRLIGAPRPSGVDSPYREREAPLPAASASLCPRMAAGGEPASFRDTESFVLNVAPVRLPEDLTSSQLGTSTFFEENESPSRKPVFPLLAGSPPPHTISSQVPGMVNLLALLRACLHEVIASSVKVEALEVFGRLAACLDDKCRLQQIVPYLVSLLHDGSAVVQAGALSALATVLGQVDTFPPSDIKIFPEYILPSLEAFSMHRDPLVLCSYAKNLTRLAEVSKGFLEASQSLTESVMLSHQSHRNNSEDAADDPYGHLRRFFVRAARQLGELDSQGLVDSVWVKGFVRCLLLEDMERLAAFLGPEDTIDYLVPLMKDFLQTGPTWEVRCRVFDGLPRICQFIGGKATQYCVFPFLMQSLYDPEELVMNGCLRTLHKTSEFLNKTLLFSVVDSIAPLLVHPNYTVRRNVACLLDQLANNAHLNQADVLTFLVPAIAPLFLDPTVVTTDAKTIFDLSKPPLTAAVYAEALAYCRSLASFGGNDAAALRESGHNKTEASSLLQQYLTVHAKALRPADREALRLLEPFVVATVSYFPSGASALLAVGVSEKPEQYEFLDLSGQVASSSSSTPVKKRKRTLSTLVADGDHLYSPFSKDTSESPEKPSDLHRLSSSGIQRAKSPAAPSVPTDWRPSGRVLATVVEHVGCVNRLAACDDGRFFVSGGEDRAVRLWSTVGLVEACSRSLATTQTTSPITALASTPTRSSFLVGERNGSVTALVVAQGGLRSEASFSLPSGVVEIAPIDANAWIACTANGTLYGMDVREKRPVFQQRTKPVYGAAQSFIFHRRQQWGVVGTTRGVYSLWDLRLLLEVKHWTHPHEAEGGRRAGNPGIFRMALDGEADSPFFLAAVSSAVFRWNAASGNFDRVFRACGGSAFELPGAPAPLPTPPAYAEASCWTAKVEEQGLNRALLAVPGAGSFLAGSADGYVRLWDVREPRASRVLSGHRDPMIQSRFDSMVYHGGELSVVQEYLHQCQKRPRASNNTHKDAVMDLVAVQSGDPDLGSVLLSCSRDGAIKAWH